MKNIIKKDDYNPIYFTEDGLKNLKSELSRLKKILPEIIAETQRTAAYGDRSDNAEYKESKGLLRRTQRQIDNIENQIKHATVITSGPNISNTIHIGSTVILEENKIQKIFQIVGPQETNPSKNRISYQSPLGAALIKHKQNDIIIFKTENGIKKYRILKIQ